MVCPHGVTCDRRHINEAMAHVVRTGLRIPARIPRLALAIRRYDMSSFSSRPASMRPAHQQIKQPSSEQLRAFQDLHKFSDTQLRALCRRKSVVARLGSSDQAPKFESALRDLVDEFRMSTQQLVTFTQDSVAVRLGQPEFHSALRAMRDEFSMSTGQLVTFIGSDSVAVRLGNPEFHSALRAMRDEFSMSTGQLVQFTGSGSVASRLVDRRFQQALRKVFDCCGVPCSISLLRRASCAASIVDMVDDFCALIEHCCVNGVQPSDVAGMLGAGKLNSAIPQLRHQLSQLHGEALQHKVGEFAGSYAHKNKKAMALLADARQQG